MKPDPHKKQKSRQYQKSKAKNKARSATDDNFKNNTNPINKKEGQNLPKKQQPANNVDNLNNIESAIGEVKGDLRFQHKKEFRDSDSDSDDEQKINEHEDLLELLSA
eukprot:Pgem_evm1s16855